MSYAVNPIVYGPKYWVMVEAINGAYTILDSSHTGFSVVNAGTGRCTVTSPITAPSSTFMVMVTCSLSTSTAIIVGGESISTTTFGCATFNTAGALANFAGTNYLLCAVYY